MEALFLYICIGHLIACYKILICFFLYETISLKRLPLFSLGIEIAKENELYFVSLSCKQKYILLYSAGNLFFFQMWRFRRGLSCYYSFGERRIRVSVIGGRKDDHGHGEVGG